MRNRNIHYRLRKSIRKRILSRKDRFLLYKYGKINLLLDQENLIDKDIFYHGKYEEKCIRDIINHINKFNISKFIDIGANFGIYSLKIAQKFPDIEVFSLEPDKRVFAQLHANCFINDYCDRIELYQIAASDRESEVYLERYPGNPGKNRLLKHGSMTENSTIPISRRRLDNLFDFKNQRIAVKIDVEGHELEVIAGMPNLLADNSWLMMIESFDDKILKLKEILIEKGFRYVADWGDSNHFFIKPESGH